jgi:hypothetical protein
MLARDKVAFLDQGYCSRLKPPLILSICLAQEVRAGPDCDAEARADVRWRHSGSVWQGAAGSLGGSETASRPGTRSLADNDWRFSIESRTGRREEEKQKGRVRREWRAAGEAVLRQRVRDDGGQLWFMNAATAREPDLVRTRYSVLPLASRASARWSIWKRTIYFWPVRGTVWSRPRVQGEMEGRKGGKVERWRAERQGSRDLHSAFSLPPFIIQPPSTTLTLPHRYYNTSIRRRMLRVLLPLP